MWLGPPCRNTMITDFALPNPREPSSLLRALRRALPGKKLRQVQTEEPDGAGAKQFPPRGSFAGVAAVSRNDQHGILLSSCTKTACC